MEFKLLSPASSDEAYPTIKRLNSSYNPLDTFALPRGDDKQYRQQYGDMYFLRLAMLKPAVEQLAAEAWGEMEVLSTLHVDIDLF